MIIPTSIERFDGAIVNDPRSNRSNVARVISNFDVLTDERRMIPYRNSEDGDANSSTSQKRNFALALRTGTTYSLYALGVRTGTALAEVLYKDLTTGSSWDLDDSAWNTPVNNQSSTGSVNGNLFVYYQLAGLIIGAKGGDTLFAFSPTGSAWDDTWQSLSYTNMAQGLVHSKDDILYIPYDNKIASYNHTGTVWTAAAITVPAHYKINSISEYGNYLAIGCSPLNGIGKSVVYLWDRDSSLTTLSESVDWGEGELRILEEVDGVLVGITAFGGQTAHLIHKIVFRQLVGNKSKIFEELIGTLAGAIVDSLPLAKQKVNERLHFAMSITLNGAVREGVWSVGRIKQTAPFGIVHERTSNNDTALTQGQMRSFFFVGDYLFQAHIDNGVYKVTKTNDVSGNFATSIYESIIFHTKGSHETKKLLGVSVMFEPLPANGQVVLKTRKNEETSWTTVFTEATDDAISHDSVIIEPTGANFGENKEREFRIESTGGAVITGLYFAEEIIPKKRYN